MLWGSALSSSRLRGVLFFCEEDSVRMGLVGSENVFFSFSEGPYISYFFVLAFSEGCLRSENCI